MSAWVQRYLESCIPEMPIFDDLPLTRCAQTKAWQVAAMRSYRFRGFVISVQKGALG